MPPYGPFSKRPCIFHKASSIILAHSAVKDTMGNTCSVLKFNSSKLQSSNFLHELITRETNTIYESDSFTFTTRKYEIRNSFLVSLSRSYLRQEFSIIFHL